MINIPTTFVGKVNNRFEYTNYANSCKTVGNEVQTFLEFKIYIISNFASYNALTITSCFMLNEWVLGKLQKCINYVKT